MKLFISLILVLILIGIPLIGSNVSGLVYLFGVIIPYIAILTFVIGMSVRVLKWAKIPVPFKITTTCGQQKSLPWINNNNLESPHNTAGVFWRMALEVLFFRSLFRNTRTGLKEGPKIVYGPDKILWAASLAFHWSFLVIFIRHFKIFLQEVPQFIPLLESLDGFMQIGLPILFMTDAALLLGLTVLFLRRIVDPKLRYISLVADYFPLLLIIGIALTGVWMRYFGKVDIISVKQFTLGLFSFQPIIPDGISAIFFAHLFLVSALLIYFPLSKLVHFGGIFLSPTRNMSNNNREVRHINPWNPKVKLHTYEEWEDEFRDVMKAADMPLEKE
ncbi:MAG: sulfate reduction electron transfer complex DsrMKJOP subunit DsrM [Calditrichaeota bacterium]|jgi:nitrate reductase gamma subunit|nr:sulfate reduction electron transfer complex DsrMKJOP subunit DsrM [Calditrichota bacterium]MBT7788707.1 sulfate reduction electron transfer complex DsrMKJOP subunit DsrM [Calditrichota bacterium]